MHALLKTKPRERLLAPASTHFYRKGIHATGVGRLRDVPLL